VGGEKKTGNCSMGEKGARPTSGEKKKVGGFVFGGGGFKKGAIPEANIVGGEPDQSGGGKLGLSLGGANVSRKHGKKLKRK